MSIYADQIESWVMGTIKNDQGISLDALIKILTDHDPKIKKKALDEIKEIIRDLIDKKRIINIINVEGEHLFLEQKNGI